MQGITISPKEYVNLLKAELKLQAFEELGVDNWSGYDDAMRKYKELLKENEEEFDDYLYK